MGLRSGVLCSFVMNFGEGVGLSGVGEFFSRTAAWCATGTGPSLLINGAPPGSPYTIM